MAKHDLERIYQQLSDRYDLLLTNTFALDAGYTIDVMVLCGKSAKGRFHLYKESDDSDMFVFSVEYPEGKGYTHWHPYGVEQAISDVISFMEEL